MTIFFVCPFATPERNGESAWILALLALFLSLSQQVDEKTFELREFVGCTYFFLLLLPTQKRDGDAFSLYLSPPPFPVSLSAPMAILYVVGGERREEED